MKMEKLGHARRKVRFAIPEKKEKITNFREHGTLSYVNGTLISQRPTRVVTKAITRVPVNIQILPKISTILSDEIPPKIGFVKCTPEIDFRNHGPSPTICSGKRFTQTTIIVPEKPNRRATEKIDKLKARHIVVITTPPIRPVHPKMEDSITNSDRFYRCRLIEDILLRKRKDIKLSSQADDEIRKPQPIVEEQSDPHTITVQSIGNNLFSSEHNTGIVTDLLQRWNRFRYREATRLKTVSDENANRKDPLEAVSFRDRIKADVRRFGCYKMNLERNPSVTTLLRAARDADEQLLKIVLKKILIDGISKEALNSTDKSGRTAISYICSTNLTNFLDVLLQIPGIDVNKPDNEGNTPLHYAAQAGQSDALNMMLTRCRNLQIDAKNCLGFTPLMKAALQGRTRCAKLLLFAGASPLETDTGRGFNAEEWARFCGREACAEMLEKCTKVRVFDKTNSCRNSNIQSKVTLIRSKTNPCHSQKSESFRSKFKKMLPFGFAMKEKQNSREVNKKDLVNYLSNSAFCGTCPAIVSDGKSKLLTTLVRPLEVPKLEVTPANNQHLIKKYESKLSSHSPQSIRN